MTRESSARRRAARKWRLLAYGLAIFAGGFAVWALKRLNELHGSCF